MMTSDNPAFLLSGALKTSFGERPIHEPDPDEVLIEVKKTGICGSEIHLYLEGGIANNVVVDPFVLGHESAGIITKLGSRVRNLQVGDRVATEIGNSCRICEVANQEDTNATEALAHEWQLCAHSAFAGDHPRDGTLQRFFKLPSHLVYKLPDNLTLEDGALIEPLSCAVHAVYDIAQARVGQNIVVFGCGPIGLLCMAVAKAVGVSRIVAVDINPWRLEFAKGYAATDAFLPPRKETDENNMALSGRAVSLMKEQLNIGDRGPSGIDLIVDAAGAELCVQMGLLLVKPGGKYVQMGIGPTDVQIPIIALLVKEMIVAGSFTCGPGDFQLAIELASSGKVELKSLVTHRYLFSDAAEAYEATRMGKSADGRFVIKTLISGPEVDTSPV